MSSKSFNMRISSENLDRLNGLCKELGVSPNRARSYVINKLIESASTPDGKLHVKDLASHELISLLRDQYADLARVGGNLNSLVFLLQII